jgi:hypothetical protein
VNILAHAKSVNPSALSVGWSAARENKVTATILRRSIEPGGRTTNEIQFESSTVERRSPTSISHILSSKQELPLRDSFNSLILQTFGGFLGVPLGYHK